MTSMNHEQHIENTPSPDIPVEIDSERCPQLNTVVCRSRNGCACTSSRGEGESEGDGGGEVAVGVPLVPTADDGASEDGASIRGEEGVPEHMIEVGDLGMVSLKAVHIALAKHERCTCHLALLPDGEDYPFTACNSMSTSGFLSQDSMLVEVSSDERNMSAVSLALSTQSAGTRNTSSSGMVRGAGELFERGHPQPAPHHHFTTIPIFLGHERASCFNMEIGAGYGMRYARELSISDGATASSDHTDYDMW